MFFPPLPQGLSHGASSACPQSHAEGPLFFFFSTIFLPLFLSLECFDSLGVFFPVCIFPIPKKFKTNPQSKSGLLQVEAFFIPSNESKKGDFGGPSSQASGEVWGFSGLLDYRALLTPSTCPASSQVTRHERVRLPKTEKPACNRVEDLSLPRSYTQTLPLYLLCHLVVQNLAAGFHLSSFLLLVRQGPPTPPRHSLIQSANMCYLHT